MLLAIISIFLYYHPLPWQKRKSPEWTLIMAGMWLGFGLIQLMDDFMPADAMIRWVYQLGVIIHVLLNELGIALV